MGQNLGWGTIHIVMKILKAVFNLLKDTFQGWQRANSAMLAAALAYYAIISLAPLLVIIVSVAGLLYDRVDVREVILENVRSLAGSQVSEITQSLFESANRTPGGGLTAVISVGVLVYTASVLFAKLKEAINTLWNIAPDPDKGVILTIWTQARSILIVLLMGVILMIFMALSTVLVTLNQFIASLPPFGILPQVGAFFEYLPRLNFGVVLLIFTIFFTAVFKLLPDAKIAWRDVLLGAFVTGLLFTLGEFLIGFYLGRVSPGSAFGAASAVIVILIWIYYSMQIILFGAEFTQVYANRYGKGIAPASTAVEVVRELKDPDQDAEGE